jgi:integrase
MPSSPSLHTCSRINAPSPSKCSTCDAALKALVERPVRVERDIREYSELWLNSIWLKGADGLPSSLLPNGQDGLLEIRLLSSIRGLYRKPSLAHASSRRLSIDVLSAAPLHLRPILEMAVQTGMRLEEVLGLRWDQLDLERREVRLVVTKTNRPSINSFGHCAKKTGITWAIDFGEPIVRRDGQMLQRPAKFGRTTRSQKTRSWRLSSQRPRASSVCDHGPSRSATCLLDCGTRRCRCP